MPRGEITQKQKEILEYIKNGVSEQGFPPTVRELCKLVKLKSTASVYNHLRVLEENGYIRRDPTKPRAIEILEENIEKRLDFIQVPIVGNVAAGEPILALENIENYFTVPSEYIHNSNHFILNVKGESMIKAGILNGDYVVIESCASASNGEMVVALIDDSATVKTYYKEDGYFRLQPENDTMEPIIVMGDLKILGKVVGVFRFFKG